MAKKTSITKRRISEGQTKLPKKPSNPKPKKK
jgi:hypothetical protein